MDKEQPFIALIKKRFLTYKVLGEKAITQLEDQHIHYRKEAGDNSIYVIVGHMHGNMLSRFTDFLETDGEKPWRNRDEEFSEDPKAGKAQLFKLWEEGWNGVWTALSTLKDDDLQKKVRIRGETHLVMDALLRQVAHYAYHVGQLVYIAKSLKGKNWQSLSIPPGASDQYNQKMKAKYGSH